VPVLKVRQLRVYRASGVRASNVPDCRRAHFQYARFAGEHISNVPDLQGEQAGSLRTQDT